MIDIRSTIGEMVGMGASDIFIEAGLPLTYKASGVFRRLNDIALLPGDAKDFVEGLYGFAGDRGGEGLQKRGEEAFAFGLPGIGRLRVFAFRKQGGYSAFVRVLGELPEDPLAMHIPEEVLSLGDEGPGLYLLTGRPSSGKSTTAACILDRINTGRNCLICTVEDPVEHVHRNKMSVVSQRELFTDTADFKTGILAAMRQGAEVLYVSNAVGADVLKLLVRCAEEGTQVLAAFNSAREGLEPLDQLLAELQIYEVPRMKERLKGVLRALVSQKMGYTEGGEPAPEFVNNDIKSLP